MAKFTKTYAKLGLGLGASEAFVIDTDLASKVQSVDVAVYDIDGNKAYAPKFNADKRYNGARVDWDKDGVYVRAGDSPSYVQLKIECKVVVKTGKRVDPPETLHAIVEFKDEWGGMAKVNYPYPDNYELNWTTDRKGQRAVALLHEMVGLLPEEYRKLAGSIPIIRARDDHSWRGDRFDGAHLPFVFDTIQISNGLVTGLKDVPVVTDEDIRFVAVVVHEIAHAATYRNCLWGTHQAMASMRKLLRNPPAPLLTWWPTAIATIPVTLFALIQEWIAPRDLVSDYSEVAGWELTAALARLVRTIQLPSSLMDLGQWLWRLPSEGLSQNHPLRPNVVAGNREFGDAFGLRAPALGFTAETYRSAATKLNDADAALSTAKPAGKAAAQASYDRASVTFDKAKDALKAKAVAAGFVSDYATYDALEDMAETLCFFVFDRGQLNTLDEYYGDDANKVLKAKRKFFVDNQYLPSKPGKAVKVGSFWRGKDSTDHLDRWTVDL